MSLRDKVDQLTKNTAQGEIICLEGEGKASEVPGPVVNPEEVAEIVATTKKLENVLFEFSAFSEQLKAEKQQNIALRKDVEAQRMEVGTMLAGLDEQIKKLPGTINKSVSESLNHTVEVVGKKVSDRLNNCFGQSQTIFRAAAETAMESAEWMYHARKYLNWKAILLNLLVYPLFAISVICLFLGVWPWQLRNVADQEQLASYGRVYLAIYPRLSNEAKKEFKYHVENLKSNAELSPIAPKK